VPRPGILGRRIFEAARLSAAREGEVILSSGSWFALRLALALTVAAVFAPAALAGNTVQKNIPYDYTQALKNLNAPVQTAAGAPTIGTGGAGGAAVPTHDGRPADLVLTLYDFSSDPTQTSPTGAYQVPFWKEHAGAHSDIYVAWDDLAAPAASTQQAQTITQSQIDYIGQQYDERVWPSDVFHFGNYESRCPGQPVGDTSCAPAGKRASIMIYNIRDDAYWSSFRFYIAGYFWASLNDALGLNAIFVDSFDWANRTGLNTSNRGLSYLYEATTAHEFQHLIHNDVDSDEDSAVDEGFADMAEQFLYGTYTTSSHIANYLTYHRDSLSTWTGELYDYGNAVLFQDYLFERAGGGTLGTPGADPLAGRVKQGFDPFADTDAKFVDPGDKQAWNIVHEQGNNVEGVATVVTGGSIPALRGIFRNYALANLLDGKVSEPQWNYRNLELGGPDSDGYSIDDGIAYYDSNVSGNLPPTRKNVRRRTVVAPWGAYYRTFTGAAPGFTASFSGNANDGVSAFSPPTQWYSGLGNGLERTLEKNVTVAAGDTLKLNTWFDIEEDWDFGYVEASTDGGNTWTKLSQISSLRTGVTNITGSSAWDGAGGLTGSSGGWQSAEYSFGSVTGNAILRFRYATDEAVNGQGWYIDDVQVGGGAVDKIDSQAGWSHNGWSFTNGLQNNVWTADVYAPTAKAQSSGYSVTPLSLATSGNTTSGSTWIDYQYKKEGKAYGVVTNAPNGVFDATGLLTIAKSQG